MKQKPKRILLALIPLLMLNACSMDDDSNSNKPMSSTESNAAFINDMKNDESFYYNEFQDSLNTFSNLWMSDDGYTQKEWATFINSQSAVYKNFNTDSGQAQLFNVFANEIWFALAKTELQDVGNINSGVLLDQKIVSSKLPKLLDDNYKKAKQAKYPGTKEEWQNFVITHTTPMATKLKEYTRKEQIQSVVALDVWNTIEGRNIAINGLLEAYNEAKKNGYSGTIQDWFEANQNAMEKQASSVTDGRNTTASNHSSSSQASSSHSSDHFWWGVAGGMLLHSMLSNTSSNTTNNYYHRNNNYSYSNPSYSNSTRRDRNNNQSHSSSFSGAAGSSSRSNSNSQAQARSSSSLSGYTVTRGGFSSSHGFAGRAGG